MDRRASCRPTLQDVILGGITIAGLALVDVTELAERARAACARGNGMTRSAPTSRRRCALPGSTNRLAVLERVQRAFGVGEGLYLAHAGLIVRRPSGSCGRASPSHVSSRSVSRI